MTGCYCVIGCTRGTGLQIVRQLAARGARVRGVARDPVKARALLPAGVNVRAGDVTDPASLRRAGLGECRAIFFAVDITGGVGGRGFFEPESRIREVTYQGVVNVVKVTKETGFKGRFVLLSGMGSEFPSLTGCLLNAIKGNLQRIHRDRNDCLRKSGLDWSIGRGALLTDAPGGWGEHSHHPAGSPPFGAVPPLAGGLRPRADRGSRCAVCIEADVRRLQCAG